jgi:G:T-mismatch repair DNA endonuclease (very short patch repair protein)
LHEKGWQVLVPWECQLKDEIGTMGAIATFLSAEAQEKTHLKEIT